MPSPSFFPAILVWRCLCSQFSVSLARRTSPWVGVMSKRGMASIKEDLSDLEPPPPPPPIIPGSQATNLIEPIPLSLVCKRIMRYQLSRASWSKMGHRRPSGVFRKNRGVPLLHVKLQVLLTDPSIDINPPFTSPRASRHAPRRCCFVFGRGRRSPRSFFKPLKLTNSKLLMLGLRKIRCS